MAVRGGVVGGGSFAKLGSNPRWSPADLCRNAHDEETFGGMKRLSGSMTTLLFPRNVRAVRLGAALGLVFTARFLAAAEAAFPAIPDAPTVPMAPTLPDAAIIKEPPAGGQPGNHRGAPDVAARVGVGALALAGRPLCVDRGTMGFTAARECFMGGAALGEAG